jgi:hypothetical protein
MLANPLAKYAVMSPIFAPSTHPIQPNNVETTSASRFFNRLPLLASMLPGHRALPRLLVPCLTSHRVEAGNLRPDDVCAGTGRCQVAQFSTGESGGMRTLPASSFGRWCYGSALDSMTRKRLGYKTDPFHFFDVFTEYCCSFRSPTFRQSHGLLNDHESTRQ